MRMSVRDAAGLIDAEIQGDPGAILLGADVDSRRIAQGDLFVALPGERVDGHQFVAKALVQGTAALVRNNFDAPPLSPGRALLRVADPEIAYRQLATAECRKQDWTIIALTGSVGKTSTKEFLRTLLGARYRVGASSGNRNSTLGLPAEVLSQEEGLEIFIAEAGMNHAGELRVLGEILTPELLLYTLIAPVHTEFFSGMDALVAAKAELLEFLQPGGILILNADDPHQSGFCDLSPAAVLSYGMHKGDVRLQNIMENGLRGTEGELCFKSASARFQLPIPGRHQALNFLSAAAVALSRDMSVSETAELAASLKPSSHRGEIHHLGSDILLIDDSYNASPTAMEVMLHLLSRSSGRRVAVLGEMYELGGEEAEAHRKIGATAAHSTDLLITVGGAMALKIGEGARATGLPEAAVLHAENSDAAADLLESRMETGDIILVKASRGVALDQTIRRICGTVV